MLDSKHGNIGATVSMINLIAQKQADETAGNSPVGIGTMFAELVLGDVDELFMAESGMCDYKVEKACTFNGPAPIEPGLPVPCCVGECPLGALVDEELKDKDDSVLTMELDTDPDTFHLKGSDNYSHYSNKDIGSHGVDGLIDRHKMSNECPHAVGGHVHIGYTGWRKYWHALKKAVVKDIGKNWKIYAAIFAIIMLVDILSKWAGTLSSYLW